MENDLSVLTRLDLAKKWVLEAGNFLRTNLSAPMQITEKTRHDDLVTNFDHAVQEMLVKHILQHFPEDKILAEEDDETEQVKFDAALPHLWVLDPIDGTTNFIAQHDNFAIMLAYYEFGVGKFGLIYHVMADKLYWCDTDKAFCNEKELSALTEKLENSLIGVNSFMYRTNYEGLCDLSQRTLGVRIYGSAGISYGQLLEGKIMGYFSNLQPWDYAAGSIIAERIGFVTLNFSGIAPAFDGREKVLTCPKALLPEIKKSLKNMV